MAHDQYNAYVLDCGLNDFFLGGIFYEFMGEIVFGNDFVWVKGLGRIFEIPFNLSIRLFLQATL